MWIFSPRPNAHLWIWSRGRFAQPCEPTNQPTNQRTNEPTNEPTKYLPSG
ncbi:MAG: PT domain-containing protein [Spirochaetales bacterium]|nr:PT domain-containing protein [Spirochaetales bacterium]